MKPLDDDRKGHVLGLLDWAEGIARARWRRARWIPVGDLISAAHLGLVRAACWWRDDGVPLQGFAAGVIDHELGREYRGWRWGAARGVQLELEEHLEWHPAGPDDDRLIDAFRALRDRDREVLTRLVLFGQSHRAAARAMGMTRGALNAAWRTARGRLRRALEGAADADGGGE